MRVGKSGWLVVGLCLAGCSNKPAPPQVQPEIQGQPSAPEENPVAQQPQAEQPPKPPDTFVAEDTAPKESIGLQMGMARDDLLAALGRCAERVTFMPGGKGSRSVEVFQPHGDDCVKEFGARQFVVADNRWVRQIDGLNTAPRPTFHRPAPGQRF